MNQYRTKIDFVRSTRKGAKRTEGKFKAVIKRADGTNVRILSHPTRKQAVAWAQDYISDLRRGIDQGIDDSVDAQMTLGQLISQYNDDDAGKRICAQQSSQAQWWKDRLGNKALIHIAAKDIRKELNDYLASPCQRYCRSTGGLVDTKRARTPAARNRQLAALKAVYRWALDQEDPLVSENTALKVKNLKEDNERDQFLPRDEIIQMLQLARESQWDRCYLFLLGLVHTGSRKNEWLQMEWQRIDLDAGTAFVPTTKNGTPKVMALTPDIIDELRRIQAERPQIAGLVFPGTANPAKPFQHRCAWKTILKAMGRDYPIHHPKATRLHDLRHSAAALMIENGATTAQVAEILGHKSLASTKRYSHLDVKGKAAVTNSAMAGLR